MNLANIKSGKLIKNLSYYAFYLAVVIEVLMVLIDKSAFINPIEGRLFRVTFFLFLIKVCLTKYSKTEYLVIFLFGLLTVLSYMLTGRNELIRCIVFIAACKDIDMHKCLKMVFYMTLAGCAVIVALSLTGVLGTVSLVQNYGRGGIETRYVLGMGHPNALQCMLWALTTLGLYLYYSKMKMIHYVALILINGLFFLLTNSKTSFLVTMIIIVYSFVMTQFKKEIIQKVGAIVGILLTFGSILISIFMAASAYRVYNYYWFEDRSTLTVILQKLDTFLTGRIHSLVETEGFQGTIKSWSLFSGTSSDKFFDMGWIRLFYWYGIIPASILIFTLLILMIYFCKKKKYAEIIMISSISIYTVIEAHVISEYIGRNYMLFLVGASWYILLMEVFGKQNHSVAVNFYMKRLLLCLGAIIVSGIVIGGVIFIKNRQENQDLRTWAESEDYGGIICWGDSLTMGAGGEGTNYPSLLKQRIEKDFRISDAPILNMGVGGEDTNTILGRCGAIPFVTTENIVLTPNEPTVKIDILSANGREVYPLRQGNAGMEYVSLNGIKGSISIKQENATCAEHSYYFTVSSPISGKILVPAGTKMVTSGFENYKDYLPIVFIGENGGFESPEELVQQQKAVLELYPQAKDKDRYIVIGLHTGTEEEREATEKLMQTEFGDHFINLREYFSSSAITDAGWKLTDEDKSMIQRGMTPVCVLTADKQHFNAKGYQMISQIVYERMKQLGYL